MVFTKSVRSSLFVKIYQLIFLKKDKKGVLLFLLHLKMVCNGAGKGFGRGTVFKLNSAKMKLAE